MYGSNDPQFSMSMKNGDAYSSHSASWERLIPQSVRLYGQANSEYRREELEKFMRVLPCPKCDGKRLKEKVVAVRIAEKTIVDLTDLSVRECIAFFERLDQSFPEKRKR